jgi:predicted nucleotidyltransferase
LDLLVELEPDRSLLDLVALTADLEGLLGVRVDIVTKSSVSEHHRARIEAEAKPL